MVASEKGPVQVLLEAHAQSQVSRLCGCLWKPVGKEKTDCPYESVKAASSVPAKPPTLNPLE